jgi:hypothetical protein
MLSISDPFSVATVGRRISPAYPAEKILVIYGTTRSSRSVLRLNIGNVSIRDRVVDVLFVITRESQVPNIVQELAENYFYSLQWQKAHESSMLLVGSTFL